MQPRSEGRIEIESATGQAGILCELARGARRLVRIFSDDLAPALFDNEELASELSRVARRGPPCEVRILIKDSQHLRQCGHRLTALHQRLVSSVPLRKLGYCPERYIANYMLVDDAGVFFIPGEDEKISFWNREDRAFVQHLAEQFDELWHKSSADPELRFIPM